MPKIRHKRREIQCEKSSTSFCITDCSKNKRFFPENKYFCKFFYFWRFFLKMAEFPDLGFHCDLESCKKLDYTPFICRGCEKVFW